MKHTRTQVIRSVYFLLIGVTAFVWTRMLSELGASPFLVLAMLLAVSVSVAISDTRSRPLAVTVMIPVIARLASVSVAPHSQAQQFIVMLFVLFTLGFSYAFPVIRWRLTVPGIRHALGGLLYIAAACGIGLLSGYLIRIQPLEPVAMNISQILFLFYISLSEELVFRGAILSYAKDVLHPAAAVAMTALLYATLYAGSSPPEVLLMMIASMTVSWMYYVSGRLWPGMLFTFVWKLVSVLMISHSLTFLGM